MTVEKAIPEPISNEAIGKPERSKRASQSPVAKNRSKLSIKSGMKHMKHKFESKSKKMPAQKCY